jgi:hypothetical protein
MNRTTAFILSALLCAVGAASADTPDWSDTVSVEDARADLEALYRGLAAAHYDLFDHRPRAEYDRKFEETLAALETPMSRYELLLELQKFTAYGNVAHARIDYPTEVYGNFRENGGKAFPIYLRIVDGRAFVGEDYSGADEIWLGDEILEIDGEPMASVLARTAQYISADTPYIAHSILESGFPMYLWVEQGERDFYTLTLDDGSGEPRRIRIPGLAYDELIAALEDAPPVFQLDYNARDARMLTDEIAYLRPGPFYNAENPEQVWDTGDFVALIDEAFESFLEHDAGSLIIDLRSNPGGDNSFSDPIISWIADEPFRFASKFLVRSSDEAAASNQARLDANPGAAEGVSGRYAKAFATTPRGESFEFEIEYAEPRDGRQFEGDVYVLVNRNSYSNAVNTASIFQDYGWGTIAGEMTADYATTYGAMEHFALPKTGFRVGFPKAHIIRPSGDERTGGVVPDIPIVTPIVPSPNDVVLEQLIDWVEAR